MPKIYVAYRTDAGAPGQRAASGSETGLKAKIREAADSHWKIATYKIKPDVPTLIKIIEDIANMPFEGSLEDVYINSAGQVRKNNT